MGYTKIHAITATVDRAIDYICDPGKTDDGFLVSSFGCSPQTAAYDFKFALSKTGQADKNKAYHLIQSFTPGEVSSDEAHRIGTELADRLLQGKYSYVVTTHMDRDHCHNHIIFCAADNIDHRKYHDCKKTYYQIRHLNDDLCREHGLYVIPDNGQKGKSYSEWLAGQKHISWKSQLKADINEAIRRANSYEEFLLLLRQRNCEVENADFDSPGKYIKFRPAGSQRFIRGSERSLGKNFTRERIRERIENKARERTSKMLHSNGIRNLIDTSADKKFSGNVGLEKWADKQNLKLAAKTYAALNEKGVRSMEELEERIAGLSRESSSTRKDIVTLEKQMRGQALLLKYAEQYAENRPYHLKYRSAKNPDAVFRKYEPQLLIYEAAREMLKKEGLNPAKVNPADVRSEYQRIEKRHGQLSAAYKEAEKERRELQDMKKLLEQYVDSPGRQPSRMAEAEAR